MKLASPDNILIDRNFLFDFEISNLLDHIKNYNGDYQLQVGYLDEENKPINITPVPFRSSECSEECVQVLDSLINRIQKKIEYKFGQRLYIFKPVWGRAWGTGAYQLPHSDSEYNNGQLCVDDYVENDIVKEHIPRFLAEYSTMVYLNDDYDGGELNFPDYSLKIKPKKGDIITFPTNAMYLHEVKKVTSGVRYNVALNWYRTSGIVANSLPYNERIKDALIDLKDSISYGF